MSEIQSLHPIPFIFVSTYTKTSTLKRAAELNPETYLTKPFSESQFLTSIRLVLSKLIEQRPPTSRKLSIIREIATGKSTREIAQTLEITINTIENHRKYFPRKYQINSSPELIRLAAPQNWFNTHGART